MLSNFRRLTAGMAMDDEDRLFVTIIWNAFVVFFSLLYLTGGFVKPAIIAAFVLVSTMVGYGRRWLVPIGFLLGIVSIAVALGAPRPERWPELVQSLQSALEGSKPFFAALH
jgi:hypothetical protein